jgi:hypothetical protein
MPQTRFVLKKAFQHELRPIVIINKIDRPDARAHEVLDLVFELFMELGAGDEALDFPVLCASGLSGGFGLSSKVRLASPSTTGASPGGLPAAGLRCLRLATANSSPTRSFSFASSWVSVAFVAASSANRFLSSAFSWLCAASCSRSAALSSRTLRRSTTQRQDHSRGSVSIPY